MQTPADRKARAEFWVQLTGGTSAFGPMGAGHGLNGRPAPATMAAQLYRGGMILRRMFPGGRSLLPVPKIPAFDPTERSRAIPDRRRPMTGLQREIPVP